jgi:hypothetical protein
MHVWDVVTGELVLGPLHGHSQFVLSVDFSPDDHYIASCEPTGPLLIRDVSTGSDIHRPIRGHQESPSCVRFSTDGLALVSGPETALSERGMSTPSNKPGCYSNKIVQSGRWECHPTDTALPVAQKMDAYDWWTDIQATHWLAQSKPMNSQLKPFRYPQMACASSRVRLTNRYEYGMDRQESRLLCVATMASPTAAESTP